MIPERRSSIIIGSLFLAALIPNVIANEIQSAILDKEHYLSNVYPNMQLFIFSNLLNIFCGFAMMFIPIVLFTVVDIKHKFLAFGYIVFRSLEGILFLYIAIKTLGFIGLSQQSIENQQIGQSILYVISNQLKSEIQWTNIVYLICFCSGAFLFYLLLYKSQMVPRWLSIWGLLSILVLAIGTIMAMFGLGVFNSLPILRGMVYFAPPIALNEFVLSFWLIIKGFQNKN